MKEFSGIETSILAGRKEPKPARNYEIGMQVRDEALGWIAQDTNQQDASKKEPVDFLIRRGPGITRAGEKIY